MNDSIKILVLLLLTTLSSCGSRDRKSSNISSSASTCTYEQYERWADALISEQSGRVEKVKRIAGAFSKLYLTKPDIYWWPGMAAIAQNSFVPKIITSGLISEDNQDRAFTATEQVFKTGFVPLIIYLSGGINEVNRLGNGSTEIGGLDTEAVKGLKLIDAGHVLAGNSILLAREHKILQKYFYRFPLGLLGPALSTFACTNFSDSLFEMKCFAASYPFSSFQNFEKRTEWNTDVLLPSFAQHHKQRRNDLEVIVQEGESLGKKYPDLTKASICN